MNIPLSRSVKQGAFSSVRENYEQQYRAVRILKNSAVPARIAFSIRNKDARRLAMLHLAEQSYENHDKELSGWHSAREVDFRNRKLDVLAEQMGLNDLSLLTPAEKAERGES